MIKFLKPILKLVYRAFFPHYCPICDAAKTCTYPKICFDCLSTLPLSYSWHKYDNKLYKKIEGKCVVQYCAYLLQFRNDNITKKIIHEIKYNNNKELGYEFGSYFAIKLKETIKFDDIDCIIPVPLHPRKEKKRGYNQSYWIAAGIAKEMNIDIYDDCIERIINNPTQTMLSKEKRYDNVKGVFKVININKLKGKRIIIIDDVATTGSTLSSLINELNTHTENTYISAISIAVTN